MSYSNTKLKSDFYKIYQYRSKALHEGIGIPEPMCRPPYFNSHGFYEKPLKKGWASGQELAIWKASDVPMYLNTFEYIVRNALKKWWQSLKAT